MTSTLLSIDVGIKNLSYCYFIISSGQPMVKEWKNLNIMNENPNKVGIEVLVEHILMALTETFTDQFESDVVLIENQPMLKNGLMKTVAVVIYTYFNMLKLQFGSVKEVRFVSASNKLKCKRLPKSDENNTKDYKSRKQLSIKIVDYYIKDLCPDLVPWYNVQKKKDDLADAMCQGIHYLENKNFADKLI
jgi:hypothetical protein